MTVVRWQRLIVVAVLTGSATWAIVKVINGNSSGSLTVPWVVSPLLVTIGVIVLWLARAVRQFLRGKKPGLDAMRAARTVALAAAASWTGALLAGWYGGQALALLGFIGAPSPRSRAISAAVACVVACLLAVAGQIAQHWCRLPPEDGHGNASATMSA